MEPFIQDENDKEVVDDIYNLLYDFVYSIAIHRTIWSHSKEYYNPQDDSEHFWYAISDNCIQQAVADWCKVFGSIKERTHYTNVYSAFTTAFEQALEDKGIDLSGYSKAMKNFRDTFISHRDKKERRKPIPELDSALIICYLFEEIVLCGEANRLPFGLHSFYEKSCANLSQYLDLLGVQNI